MRVAWHETVPGNTQLLLTRAVLRQVLIVQVVQVDELEAVEDVVHQIAVVGDPFPVLVDAVVHDAPRRLALPLLAELAHRGDAEAIVPVALVGRLAIEDQLRIGHEPATFHIFDGGPVPDGLEDVSRHMPVGGLVSSLIPRFVGRLAW